jgi:hypothetical protein
MAKKKGEKSVYRRQGGEGGTLYLREEIKEKERRSA